MIKSAVVVGTQWGDEGKGKITDYLSQKADMIVRYQGGNNAGHTIVFNNNKYSLHLIPSGIFSPEKKNVLANGMVINLEALRTELGYLRENGFEDFDLAISDRAHIVMPYHVDLDKYFEKMRGEAKVGTTLKGIGPAYTDKYSRVGIRIGDLRHEETLLEKIEFNLKTKEAMLKEVGVSYSAVDLKNQLMEYYEEIKDLIEDTSILINQYLDAGKKVLFEGAQGVMLCTDHGTYPFVTSSSPTASSIPINTGVGTNKISNVVGISKAYSTRVGSGAFPTEFEDDIAKVIREVGNEYGTTTGRPRRIGWFDSVVVRHAVRVGSVTTLSIMLLDVLTGIKDLKICIGYKLNGKEIDYIPSSIEDFAKCEPVYITLPGWEEDISSVTSYEMLPENAKNYIKNIEKYCEVDVSIFSVGPDRKQTVMLKEVI